MKNLFIKFFIILICIGMISACGTGNIPKTDKKINIVCTVFPQYDWVREIIKGAEDRVSVSLIAGNGTDIHSYQPTAEDIIKIGNCDLLIYTNGESEAWVSDAVRNSGNSNIKIIDMLNITGRELHDDDNHKHSGYTDEAPDEHIWLSLENAEEICDSIADALESIDPAMEDLYEKNTERYCRNLEALDEKYKAAVRNGKYRTLIFADRFPFRYMTDDYGLEVYAAFPGCSAESEASFETVADLSAKLSELNLPAVMVTDNTNTGLADTVIKNAGGERDIISLNSMQSVNMQDIENGITYISVMTDNLKALEKALNR